MNLDLKTKNLTVLSLFANAMHRSSKIKRNSKSNPKMNLNGYFICYVFRTWKLKYIEPYNLVYVEIEQTKIYFLDFTRIKFVFRNELLCN